MKMLEKLYDFYHPINPSYFIRRLNSSLPQHVMSLVTLLGSFAPSSFTSTMIHAQHLHRIVAFGQSIVLKEYIQECVAEGLHVDIDLIEADTKDKLRAVLLLKTILCTRASDVMIFHNAWNQVIQNMYTILNILYTVSFSCLFDCRV